MKEKTIIILRWIAVVPGAIAAYLIGYNLSKWTYRFSMYAFVSSTGDGGWFNKYGIEVLSTGIGAFCFVHFGSKIAPRFTKETCFWLMIIELVMGGGILFFNMMKSEWYLSVQVVALIIGAIVAYKSYEDEVREGIQ